LKKTFHIAINVTSTVWESASAYVEAETLEEAMDLFEENPHDYDWDDWDTIDSNTDDWWVDTQRCYCTDRDKGPTEEQYKEAWKSTELGLKRKERDADV
jgi:hypothetical protein